MATSRRAPCTVLIQGLPGTVGDTLLAAGMEHTQITRLCALPGLQPQHD
jgi:hypothetical protein